MVKAGLRLACWHGQGSLAGMVARVVNTEIHTVTIRLGLPAS